MRISSLRAGGSARHAAAGLLLLLTLAACMRTQVPEPPLTGADRDAHGCIGSAGYSWCARSGQCDRPWERAAAQNFELSPSAFDQSCDNHAS